MVFLALKQNTNIYNLKAAAALNVSVTDDSYMSAPADCTYANDTQKAGSRRLLDMDMGSDTVGCVQFDIQSFGRGVTNFIKQFHK